MRRFTHQELQKLIAENKFKPKRQHVKTSGRYSFNELTRIISEAWKALDNQNKSLLQEYAGIEKQRYLKEMQEWRETIARQEGISSSQEVLMAISSPRNSRSQLKKQQRRSRLALTTLSDPKVIQSHPWNCWAESVSQVRALSLFRFDEPTLETCVNIFQHHVNEGFDLLEPLVPHDMDSLFEA